MTLGATPEQVPLNERGGDERSADETGTDGAGNDRADAGQSDGDGDALLSRLRMIEDRPLDERPSAYGTLHAELSATLEGGDARSPR